MGWKHQLDEGVGGKLHASILDSDAAEKEIII